MTAPKRTPTTGSPSQTRPSNPRTVIAAVDGVEIAIEHSPEFPELRRIVVQTPHTTYNFGDYPVAEALETADKIDQDRKAWQPSREDHYWEPNVWQTREVPDGVEFWRRGPGGTELSAFKLCGRSWGIAVGDYPIIWDKNGKPAFFENPFEAIGVLSRMAEDGMLDDRVRLMRGLTQ